eukprot:Tbor_TRINITY_DN5927_c0_g2::TRINITY_DN5927_c0_g2_i1::g.18238::m.18238/K14553/UTP18; U3 small nucleolar RNA-associated protein 18
MSKISKKERAWSDEEDDLPNFLQESAVAPAWAKQEFADEKGEEGETSREMKRSRNEELDKVLSSTAPVLTSIHQRQHAITPKVISTFSLPKNECVTDIKWHRNGQLAIIGSGQGLHLFHNSGASSEYVAKLGSAGKGDRQRPVQQIELSHNGEDAAVRMQYTYYPSIVHLSTGQVTAMKFLDVRESTPTRNRGTTMIKEEKFDNYYTKICRPKGIVPAHSEYIDTDPLAVVSGRSILVGSLKSGSVAHKIHVNDDVHDCIFSSRSGYELYAACASKVILYDLRKSAEAVSQIQDKGTVGVRVIAQHSDMSNSRFAMGTVSGVVTLYDSLSAQASGVPTKTFTNLSTTISGLCFNDDASMLVFWSKDQKNGLRLAMNSTTDPYAVLPGFPPQTSRHGFIHCAGFCDSQSLLSVSDSGKVLNYAL